MTHCGYCTKDTPNCRNSIQPTCDICGLLRTTTNPVGDAKEPRTAEQWESWIQMNSGRNCDWAHDPEVVIEAIRRAQEQAKNEAFVECATVCEVRKLITTEIRAYDKGFREGVATTTEKMQIATDVLVKQARTEAIRDFSVACKEDSEWLYEFKQAVRREAIEECNKILENNCHNWCPNSGDCDASEEIRALLEKK